MKFLKQQKCDYDQKCYFSNSKQRLFSFISPLGVNKGVCRDEEAHVSGTNDNQIQTYSRERGITRVSKSIQGV